MWQEYHVFGLTRAGESPEEGKEENTEKVRLYYNHIPAEYMENFEVRKYNTFTILTPRQPLQSSPLVHIYILWKLLTV